MLDFAMRVGFEIRLCRPYRAQTKGKVESGVKYVKGNMWPSMRFTDAADLNRQGLEWCDTVANVRVHGTTQRVPWEMLVRQSARNDPAGALGDAGRGAVSLGPAARPRGAGALSAGGPEGGAGRIRQLGGIPVRSPLEVGGPCRAGGTATGGGGDLGRR